MLLHIKGAMIAGSERRLHKINFHGSWRLFYLSVHCLPSHYLPVTQAYDGLCTMYTKVWMSSKVCLDCCLYRKVMWYAQSFDAQSARRSAHGLAQECLEPII